MTWGGMISPSVADAVGLAGTACIIGAYAYLTASKAPNPFVLHGVNLLGAVLLTISLLVHTNLASLVLEGFWAAIAVWGLAKAFRRRRPTPRPPLDDARDKLAGGATGPVQSSALAGSSNPCRDPSREREGTA